MVEGGLLGARSRSGVPASGALDDLAHAVEPEGRGLPAALAASERAARSGVLDAEFELRITIYVHFHGNIVKHPL